MITNMEQLKLMNESRIVKQKEGEKGEEKKTMTETIKGKLHNIVYAKNEGEKSGNESEKAIKSEGKK